MKTLHIFLRGGGKGLVIALAYVFLIQSAVWALPQGGAVESGAATFDTSVPNTLNITTTTDQAIINWQSFNIAQNETVNFAQPSALAAVLNRVVGGGGASSIAGALNSNGTIILVNPAGVTIAETANINVGAFNSAQAASFVASSLNISSSDFRAGNYVFQKEAMLSAAVINKGIINVHGGGLVLLFGGSVENSGTINAQLGKVVLASGDKITVNFTANGLISVAVDEKVMGSVVTADGKTVKDAVKNLGAINADGGQVILTAEAVSGIFDKAVNCTGIVRANSVIERNGIIELVSKTGTTVNKGVLQAKGTAAAPNGGKVSVYGHKAVQDGVIDVSAHNGGTAGKVTVNSDLGGTILMPQSLIDAGGHEIMSKAGEVLINSLGNTIFAPDARIDISGGLVSGDGGFAEVSAHQSLGFYGTVDGLAQSGYQRGALLIDPISITISGVTTDYPAYDDISVYGGPIGPDPNNIQFSVINSSTTDVELVADGDITIEATAAIDFANLLELDAGGSIFIHSDVRAGALAFTAGNAILGTGTPDLTATAGVVSLEANNIDSLGALDGANGVSVTSWSDVTWGITFTSISGANIGVRTSGTIDGNLTDVTVPGQLILDSNTGINNFGNLQGDYVELRCPSNNIVWGVNFVSLNAAAGNGFLIDADNIVGPGVPVTGRDGVVWLQAEGDINNFDDILGWMCTIPGWGKVDIDGDVICPGGIDINGNEVNINGEVNSTSGDISISSDTTLVINSPVTAADGAVGLTAADSVDVNSQTIFGADGVAIMITNPAGGTVSDLAQISTGPGNTVVILAADDVPPTAYYPLEISGALDVTSGNLAILGHTVSAQAATTVAVQNGDLTIAAEEMNGGGGFGGEPWNVDVSGTVSILSGVPVDQGGIGGDGGEIHVNDMTSGGDMTIKTTEGSVELEGPLTSGGAITLDAGPGGFFGGGAITLNDNVISAGDISFGKKVNLDAADLLIDTGGAGNIVFAGAIENSGGFGGGANVLLTLDASDHTVAFLGAVGTVDEPLKTLQITSDNLLVGTVTAPAFAGREPTVTPGFGNVTLDTLFNWIWTPVPGPGGGGIGAGALPDLRAIAIWVFDDEAQRSITESKKGIEAVPERAPQIRLGPDPWMPNVRYNTFAVPDVISYTLQPPSEVQRLAYNIAQYEDILRGAELGAEVVERPAEEPVTLGIMNPLVPALGTFVNLGGTMMDIMGGAKKE